MIIYYERYVVIQAGTAVNNEGEALQFMDFLTEEEYLDALERIPADNRYLDDEDPKKVYCKDGCRSFNRAFKTFRP